MTGERTENCRWIRLPEGGVCYRVVTWLVGAVEQEHWERQQTTKSQLLQRMQQAACDGKSGEVHACEKQLNALNLSTIAEAYDFRARDALALTRVRGLREAMHADEAVLGFRLGEGALSVWMQLVDERSPREHLAAWCAAASDAPWSGQSLISQQSSKEAQEELRLLCGPLSAAVDEEAEEEKDATNFHHVTVLAEEAVSALLPDEGKVIVDATLGGGGHSELLLRAGASVWGIDRDPSARAAARLRLKGKEDRLHIVAGNFGDIKQLLNERGVHAVDGVLADLGVSSPQLDTPERGFSFRTDGPLDMRMNPSQERKAADIVNNADEQVLADILWQYGEEKAARAIARRIVQQRSRGPIRTTGELADVICSVLPRKGRLHPATRSFQALRMAVNDEPGELERLLEGGYELLRRGGRMSIITFHSLEDRTVKQFFARVSTPELDRPEWPAPRPNPAFGAKLITRKPIQPAESELANNPRARSAKLRVIEKL